MEKKIASYFTDNFNTPLTDQQEQQFQKWVAGVSDRDLSLDLADYDLRGFWLSHPKEAEVFARGKGHAPDTYKKPNHVTFSNESIYSGTPSPFGDTWEGGRWIDENKFQPSTTMLKTTHVLPYYQDFFKRAEPDAELLLPASAPTPTGRR